MTLVDPVQALNEYGIKISDWKELPKNVDAIVAAVPHAQFTNKSIVSLLAPLKSGGVFVDIKSAFLPEDIKSTGASLWRL